MQTNFSNFNNFDKKNLRKSKKPQLRSLFTRKDNIYVRKHTGGGSECAALAGLYIILESLFFHLFSKPVIYR